MTNHHMPEHDWRARTLDRAKQDTLAHIPEHLRWDAIDAADDLREALMKGLGR